MILKFSAQVITVLGDITVDKSPAIKPFRVNSAKDTIWLINFSFFPKNVGTLAKTIFSSISFGK